MLQNSVAEPVVLFSMDAARRYCSRTLHSSPCVLYGDDNAESSANAPVEKIQEFTGHTIGRCSKNFPLCYMHKTKDTYFSQVELTIR